MHICIQKMTEKDRECRKKERKKKSQNITLKIMFPFNSRFISHGSPCWRRMRMFTSITTEMYPTSPWPMENRPIGFHLYLSVHFCNPAVTSTFTHARTNKRGRNRNLAEVIKLIIRNESHKQDSFVFHSAEDPSLSLSLLIPLYDMQQSHVNVCIISLLFIDDPPIIRILGFLKMKRDA